MQAYSEHTLGIVKLISFIILQAYVLSTRLRIVQLNSFITLLAYFEHKLTHCAVELFQNVVRCVQESCNSVSTLRHKLSSRKQCPKHTFNNCAAEFRQTKPEHVHSYTIANV